MGTYLMMLYVSLEQELAVKDLFTDKGWGFSKPDLRLTTDDVGPLTEQTVRDNNVLPVCVQQDHDQNVQEESTQETMTDVSNQSSWVPFMQQLMPVSKPTRVEQISNKQVKQFDKVPVSYSNTNSPPVSSETQAAAVCVKQTINQSDMINPEVRVKVEHTDVDDNTSDYDDGQIQNDQNNDNGNKSEKSALEESVIQLDQSGPSQSTMKTEITTEESQLKKKPPNSKKRKKTSQGDGATGTKKAAKMFQCDKCTKSYNRYSSLYKHSKKLHEDERPFKCEVCHKTFVFSEALNEHMVTHTDVKTHICPICGKGFKQRAGMNKHLTVHQDPKYTCEICGKHFDRNVYLRSHLKTHGDKQKCLACKASVYHLDKHLCKANRTIPMHECHICKKKFRQKRYLKNHISRLHLQNHRFYNCESCDMSFNYSGSLSNHKKNCAQTNQYTCDRATDGCVSAQDISDTYTDSIDQTTQDIPRIDTYNVASNQTTDAYPQTQDISRIDSCNVARNQTTYAYPQTQDISRIDTHNVASDRTTDAYPETQDISRIYI